MPRATPTTSEKVLQTHAVSALMKLALAGRPILFAGDMAGQRRTPAEALWAKATGLVAGEPDLPRAAAARSPPPCRPCSSASSRSSICSPT